MFFRDMMGNPDHIEVLDRGHTFDEPPPKRVLELVTWVEPPRRQVPSQLHKLGTGHSWSENGTD